MPYVVTESCVDVKDRSCVGACPVDCIYEGNRMMYIHPDECIDCGACEAVCPVSAIYYHAELPEESQKYLPLNEEFFEPLGSPRGARKVGGVSRDVPYVAGLPAKDAD